MPFQFPNPFENFNRVFGCNGNVWAYNIGGLSTWRSAVGSIAPGDRVHAVIAGSSIGLGVGATIPTTEGYAYLLSAWLKSTHGDGGTPHRLDEAGFVAGTGWSTGVLGIYQYSRHGAAGASGTLTVTLTGLSFDIYYIKYNNSGAFTAQLDSDPPVSMGGVGGGTITYHRETLTAASEGAHLITITPGAGGIAYIWAIGANTSGGGIVPWNVSRNGALISTFYTGSASDLLGASCSAIQQKLYICELTTNDYNAQTALATYNGYLTGTVSNLALPYGSCLLVSDPLRLDQSKAIKQPEYDAKNLDASNALGAAYISIAKRWYGYRVDFDSDGIHPNTAGHADIFAAISNFL